MATLKEHQAAMVQLLANGSGIPASASRLAHAMHDVLKALDVELCDYRNRIDTADKAVDAFAKRIDATTPGLNDKALAADVEACRKPEVSDSLLKRRERRIKELENTVNQLRASNAEFKAAKQDAEGKVYELQERLTETERMWRDSDSLRIEKTHLLKLEQSTVRQLQEQLAEQAGCRKDDTQVCEHSYTINMHNKTLECGRCGDTTRWPNGFNPSEVRV